MSLFGSTPQDTRAVFFKTWEKMRQDQPLEGVEVLIATIARAHPEYHALLSDPENSAVDFSPEDGQINPFLHMGMHIAIEEQLSTDRPSGIRDKYQRLLLAGTDPHEAQHLVMDCLGEMLWHAQRNGTAPDETAYLECLDRLASN